MRGKGLEDQTPTHLGQYYHSIKVQRIELHPVQLGKLNRHTLVIYRVILWRYYVPSSFAKRSAHDSYYTDIRKAKYFGRCPCYNDRRCEMKGRLLE